ncbi:MAG: hypothetical protein ABW106_15070 [Steroidobacteraceae bacterium]
MATETAGTAGTSPNYGFEWYVHKHRREHEAANWDERRVQVPEAPAAPVVVNHLLIKFVACAVALTATLGIVVTVIR